MSFVKPFSSHFAHLTLQIKNSNDNLTIKKTKARKNNDDLFYPGIQDSKTVFKN